jgi:uncharacterized protein YdaU (DUF1376 family)
MKYLLPVTMLLIFTACQDTKQPSPMQNSALNSVSKSSAVKKRDGFLQQELNSWFREDKEVKKQTTIDTKTALSKEEESKGFLQEQLDSITVKDAEEKATTPSHLKQMQSMPVIGN